MEDVSFIMEPELRIVLADTYNYAYMNIIMHIWKHEYIHLYENAMMRFVKTVE